MALDMFLKLDGIQGTSTQPNGQGAIDVLAYSWGVSHQPPSGTTHPKPNLQDFSFTIYEDAYSPLLFKACVLGSVIKNATMTIFRVGSDTPNTPTTSFQLTGVRVTSISDGASGGEDRPTQNVTLDFGTVKYTTNDPPSPSTTYGWNATTNSPL